MSTPKEPGPPPKQPGSTDDLSEKVKEKNKDSETGAALRK